MSAWIKHVKQYANAHNLKYGEALKDPGCKNSYHLYKGGIRYRGGIHSFSDVHQTERGGMRRVVSGVVRLVTPCIESREQQAQRRRERREARRVQPDTPVHHLTAREGREIRRAEELRTAKIDFLRDVYRQMLDEGMPRSEIDHLLYVMYRYTGDNGMFKPEKYEMELINDNLFSLDDLRNTVDVAYDNLNDVDNVYIPEDEEDNWETI